MGSVLRLAINRTVRFRITEIAVAAALCALLLSLASSFNPITGTPVSAAEGAAPNFIFEPAVKEADRVLIEEGVRFAQDFFIDEFAMPPDAELSVNVRAGSDPTDRSVVAFQLGHSIVIYAGSPGWTEGSPALRLQTVLHEFTHFYQFIVVGNQTAAASWFDEGSAEFLAMYALDQAGIIDRGDFDSFNGWQLDALPTSFELWQIESPDDFDDAGPAVYPLAYLAVAELVDRSDMSAVPLLYALLRDGVAFPGAFEQAFAMTTDEFYEQVEEWVDDTVVRLGYPDAYIPIADYTSQHPVVWMKRFAFVSAGEQTLIQALTDRGAICSLNIAFGSGGSITREGFSDGAGEVFWLVTIPPSAPSGQATASVDCGMATIEASVLIEAA